MVKKLSILFLFFLFTGSIFGESSVSYQYDAQGRLVSVTYNDSMSITYTYDAAGNILSVETAPDTGTVHTDPNPEHLPESFALQQNYPNPFNPGTQIDYQLPEQGVVNLTIFNLLGERIRTLVNGEKPAGYHQIRWKGVDADGKRVTSGIYFYRLTVKTQGRRSFTATEKMVLLR